MPVVGYFTAEIGLWSELHTYSGGLGVLAGDHVKSAQMLAYLWLALRSFTIRDMLGSTLILKESKPKLFPKLT